MWRHTCNNGNRHGKSSRSPSINVQNEARLQPEQLHLQETSICNEPVELYDITELDDSTLCRETVAEASLKNNALGSSRGADRGDQCSSVRIERESMIDATAIGHSASSHAQAEPVGSAICMIGCMCATLHCIAIDYSSLLIGQHVECLVLNYFQIICYRS